MALSLASKASFEHLSSTEEMRENGIKVDAECFLIPNLSCKGDNSVHGRQTECSGFANGTVIFEKRMYSTMRS